MRPPRTGAVSFEGRVVAFYLQRSKPLQQRAPYLAKVLNRITLPGSLFLAVIAITPLLVFALWDINQFPFGGTALLITVGVALETMKQIDSQLMMRNYEGFLA